MSFECILAVFVQILLSITCQNNAIMNKDKRDSGVLYKCLLELVASDDLDGNPLHQE